ncbi:peptidoglycan editing factor PgeF [Spirabiliibacterium falconis]|uniref:peptidoglycan editing factor PgeF n=1 Tax=Spirabiliibacterium falconis TaxID=572023 RepID=UPI001AACF1D3|nr:peptidoglycan editing factor PgeF [Spirabiliibacterium falconis]MBE2893834.1 peptidoglycan editing factor PgeF [Spirabiliibacterium falconis]
MILQPDFNIAGIYAGITTRQGGVSQPPFDSFNLATHVGDEQSAVEQNRTLLVQRANLPHMPTFLNQTHSIDVVHLPSIETIPNADAAYTNQAGMVCAVLTADCLPVLFAAKNAQEVAAAHAGWRGLCNGILENTVAQFVSPASDIVAYLGPAIGSSAFQVGEEVREAFICANAEAASAFVIDPSAQDKYVADIYQLARQRLQKCGITDIRGGTYCTVNDARFFSYRRAKQTGRMASFIYFNHR